MPQAVKRYLHLFDYGRWGGGSEGRIRRSLYLGNIDIQRDWGWAEDYVEAMYLMLQQERFSFREATPTDDYVIARGESYKLALFIEIAFGLVGLDWREYVVIDKGLCRPTDLAVSRGNPNTVRLVQNH